METQSNSASPAKVLETVLKAIPCAHLVEEIDLQAEPSVVRFTWRGTRYRVDDALRCDEVGDGVLIGSDQAILLERVLRLTQAAIRLHGSVLPA